MVKKLFKKISNLQAPVKASIWFTLCAFLQKGVSMLTTPLFTRIMTESEYGSFSVYSSWFSIIQIIVTLNLAAGVYTKGLIKNEDDQDRFSSSMLGLSSTCILIWTIIYGLLHNTINDLIGFSTMIMIAMFVEIWATAAYQFWANRERATYRYKKLVGLTLLYVLMRPLCGLICVICVDIPHQMEARVISSAIVSLLLFSVLYVSINRKGKQFYNKAYWVYALKFNLPLIPHYLSQIILGQSDRLMINSICGSAFAAYYSVAYTLAMVMQMLNSSISATMNPWIYRSIKTGNTQKIGSVSYAILGILAFANIILVLTAPEFLTILAPASYQEALNVVPPVVISSFFMFMYNLFATFEFYYEKTGFLTLITFIGAGMNVLLNSICIPVFGFTAAGYTTLLCYLLITVGHYWVMRIICKQKMAGEKVYSIKLIAIIGFIMMSVIFGSMLIYHQPVLRYGILVCMLVIVCVNRKRIIGVLHIFEDGK